MKNVELILNLKQINHIEDGDEDDKVAAKKVEKTYDEIYKQVKWCSR